MEFLAGTSGRERRRGDCQRERGGCKRGCEFHSDHLDAAKNFLEVVRAVGCTRRRSLIPTALRFFNLTIVVVVRLRHVDYETSFATPRCSVSAARASQRNGKLSSNQAGITKSVAFLYLFGRHCEIRNAEFTDRAILPV